MRIRYMKKTLLCLLVFMVIICLSGCGILIGNEKKAAKEYVETKYGQKAQVIKAKKIYRLTGQGNGLPPTGIKADGTYTFIMKIGTKKFDVCLVENDKTYCGYDNYEEELIKTNVIDDIESKLDIDCVEAFFSYSELYGKYGRNMIHESFDDLQSLYESGKFAAIIATHDSLDREKIEEYTALHQVNGEKKLFRIEIIQYKDTIPELTFSSFSDTTDSNYVLDWYTISKDEVKHHND